MKGEAVKKPPTVNQPFNKVQDLQFCPEKRQLKLLVVACCAVFQLRRCQDLPRQPNAWLAQSLTNL